MIITRTPFRVSLTGGGSDIKEFYSRFSYGAVVSTAIDKYMYVVIHDYFHDKIRIKYSKTEDVSHVDDIQHPIVRECLKKVKIETGIEIASFADIPAGTGLGSSSAFTVGLLNALYAFKGVLKTKESLAVEACEIEIDILGEPIGKQDQYASAFGNMNYIKFNRDETVDVSPIFFSDASKSEIEKSLDLYYVGGERQAGDILKEQKKNITCGVKFENLEKMVELSERLRSDLQDGNVQSLGRILHEGWILKKELAKGITNENIDGIYDLARNHGALGGKLLGAGGTGFLLLYSRDHEALRSKIPCKNLDLKMDREGTKIIFFQ